MRSGNLSVDHVFMLIEAGEVDAVVNQLSRFGLTESSRRSHGGLGTSNIFYCFDNAFLEILWIANREEAGGSRLGRLLLERLDGRMSGAAPFGIGFRAPSADDPLPFATWLFEPPAELSFQPIPIALSSDDSRQPLLFRAQRKLPPDAWTDGKAGVRQQPAGLREITALRFSPARNAGDSADLRNLQQLGMIALDHSRQASCMTLTLSRGIGEASRELMLTSPTRLFDSR